MSTGVTVKVCSRCKVEKPLEAYYSCGRRKRSECKSCTAPDNRVSGNLKKQAYSLDYDLRRVHGISLVSYRTIAESQGGACYICKRIPAGKMRLVVDHCHTTGDLRGLLCIQCNTVLGNSFDSPEILRNAALYLEGHRPDINKYRAVIDQVVDAQSMLDEFIN